LYGNIPDSFLESKVYNPTTPYAASKASFDMYLDVVNRQYGFPSIMFRSANLYGAHQQLFRIVPKILISIRSNGQFNLDGGGATRRYFIHSSDLSDGVIKLMTKGTLGGIYHFGGGEYISMKELTQKVCSIVGYDFEKLVSISPDRRGKDIEYNMNFAKATHDLNWTPKVTLDEGILSVDRWVNENWQEIDELCNVH
jgi:dTDP-glucose 4,6-dehydratase